MVLAIIKVFKICRQYLVGYKHKVLILTEYNNLHHFMNSKSLCFGQVYWAQELFWYHFQIDFYQNKANRATDTFSRYLQQNFEKRTTLRFENIKILH